MKRFITTTLAWLAAASVLGQGTINFRNADPVAGLNAPVFFLGTQTGVSGPNYVAQLMAGATPDSLVFVGSPTAFFTGAAAGYFDGGVIPVPFITPGGTLYCQVVAWDTTLQGTTTGATADQALSYWHTYGVPTWGCSCYGLNSYDPMRPPFPVVTGDPTTMPPGNPAPLLGLQSFTIPPPVPEPSVLALAGLALGAYAAWRGGRTANQRQSTRMQSGTAHHR